MFKVVLRIVGVSILTSGCVSSYEGRTWRAIDEVSESLDPDVELVGHARAAYVEYARRRSPRLRAVFERWHSQAYRIARARRLPNPTVSYAFFARSVETRVGPQQHRLSFRQAFPWPSQLSRAADAAALQAAAQQRRFEAEALALEARVSMHYWTLWSIQQIRRVRDEQVQLLGQLAEMVRGRVEIGNATLADLQQLELAQARVRDGLDALDEQERSSRASLIATLGAPPGMDTPVASAAPEVRQVSESIEALRAAVVEHPARRIFEELAEASAARERAARARRLPGFMLGFDWIQTGAALGPTPGNGDDPVIISVGISVPLWQGSFADDVRAEEAQTRAFEAESQAEQDTRIGELERRLAAVRDSRRRFLLHRDTLRPQALTLHESVVSAYAVGRASVADLLMAERELLEIREREIGAATRHGIEWALLEAVVGRPVETRNE